jgi:hypothetical protein
MMPEDGVSWGAGCEALEFEENPCNMGMRK